MTKEQQRLVKYNGAWLLVLIVACFTINTHQIPDAEAATRTGAVAEDDEGTKERSSDELTKATDSHILS